MKKENLKTTFKEAWGNSVLSTNLKYWKCGYCGLLIKDEMPFGIVNINGNTTPEIFCSEMCLRIHMIKHDASKTDR